MAMDRVQGAPIEKEKGGEKRRREETERVRKREMRKKGKKKID